MACHQQLWRPQFSGPCIAIGGTLADAKMWTQAHGVSELLRSWFQGSHASKWNCRVHYCTQHWQQSVCLIRSAANIPSYIKRVSIRLDATRKSISLRALILGLPRGGGVIEGRVIYQSGLRHQPCTSPWIHDFMCSTRFAQRYAYCVYGFLSLHR